MVSRPVIGARLAGSASRAVELGDPREACAPGAEAARGWRSLSPSSPCIAAGAFWHVGCTLRPQSKTEESSHGYLWPIGFESSPFYRRGVAARHGGAGELGASSRGRARGGP